MFVQKKEEYTRHEWRLRCKNSQKYDVDATKGKSQCKISFGDHARNQMVNVQQNGERKLFRAELATQMGAPRLFLAEGLKGGVNAPGCPLVLF